MNSEQNLPTQNETLCGTVNRIVCRKENDWSVFRVDVNGNGEPATVVGYSNAQPGERIKAQGVWKKTLWGLQFSAQSIISSKPTSKDGIIRYLSSGIISGVGPKMAQAIVDVFGEDTIKVLNENPDRLKEIKGIGKKKISNIQSGWEEQKSVSEIMLFLNEHNISASLCRRIYKKYETKAIKIINTNPYKLALEISGIGFKSADKIAKQVGIAHDSPQRIKAGLVHVMQEATGNGHCGLMNLDLLQKTEEVLEVPLSMVSQVLEQELSLDDDEKRYLERYDATIYLSSIARCEERVASTLLAKSWGKVPWEIDAEAAIEQAQKDLGFVLAKQQREAVKMMLSSCVSVLTGGPGTGKTSTLNTLLHIFKKNKVVVHLVAPTGKAAQRASEVTGMDASTIHRRLGLKGAGIEPSEIEEGVLVIDESSMIDIYLMNSIAKAIKKVPVILVGDVDQLPSVGPGQVLADVIDSGAIPVTRLTEVFRQAQGSLIIRNAHNINQGLMPVKGGREDDFFFIETSELDANGQKMAPAEIGAAITETIAQLVTTRLPAAYGLDPCRDIMVLSPMNVTTSGVTNLNLVLQERINPSPVDFYERMGTRFGVGDKVIQTRNNYDLDIFNGDVGFISRIDANEAKKVFVDFSGKEIGIPMDDADSLRLAYAMTIHKSQGSQAEAVVIPVTTQHFTMLQRNLFYTGVTRAKKLVVLVGTPKAMAMAVKNADAMKRITRLKNLLS